MKAQIFCMFTAMLIGFQSQAVILSVKLTETTGYDGPVTRVTLGEGKITGYEIEPDGPLTTGGGTILLKSVVSNNGQPAKEVACLLTGVRYGSGFSWDQMSVALNSVVTEDSRSNYSSSPYKIVCEAVVRNLESEKLYTPNSDKLSVVIPFSGPSRYLSFVIKTSVSPWFTSSNNGETKIISQEFPSPNK